MRWRRLVRYAAALEDPPLQVDCDTDRFLVRTAFTDNVSKNYEFSPDELAEPKNIDILHEPSEAIRTAATSYCNVA